MPLSMDTAALVLAGCMALLQPADIITTNYVLAHGGRELNPFIRWCMRLGRWWWVPKVGIVAVATTMLVQQRHAGGLWMLGALVLLYVAVVLSNCVQVWRIRKRHRSIHDDHQRRT